MMKTLAINGSNDVYMTAKGLAFSEGEKCESDVLHAKCLTQKGELQFSGSVGIDYFGTVFEDSRKAAACAAQIRAAASKLSWVKQVKSLDYSVDLPNGVFSWKMVVIDLNGKEISVGSFRKGETDTMGISWNDISGKPDGIDDVVYRVDKITDIDDKQIEKSDTTAKVKETLNNVVAAIKSAKRG